MKAKARIVECRIVFELWELGRGLEDGTVEQQPARAVALDDRNGRAMPKIKSGREELGLERPAGTAPDRTLGAEGQLAILVVVEAGPGRGNRIGRHKRARREPAGERHDLIGRERLARPKSRLGPGRLGRSAQREKRKGRGQCGQNLATVQCTLTHCGHFQASWLVMAIGNKSLQALNRCGYRAPGAAGTSVASNSVSIWREHRHAITSS